MKARQVFTYANGTESDRRLTVEPWANQFIVRPGQKVDIFVDSARLDGVLEFEQVSGGLTVYGYEGCVVSVSSNGKELAPVTQV